MPLTAAPLAASSRNFSAYDGKNVKDEELVKKADDWAIEETNFCLGRMSFPRFKETDDLARRTKHLMDTQLSLQHTRLRDGTVIPFTGLFLHEVLDKPAPIHIFTEQPLLKWTWDETYDEAYDKPSKAK
eukprot:CAMPEP_0178414910 /NCGR_PEP_ID=MMETSP0689_2-20121128/23279_1 /TAXON_ID=160604 /ORGANISM="Amphidinium massartii, Strain CS-259" /LENGTH=128 /DNA_ID=CAMNT_0020036213 /DNA_START=123 /DNA_END=509 /DNA_ORIENTATION=+